MTAADEVMDMVCEDLMEADGGIFCPKDCEKPGPLEIIDTDTTQRVVIGNCPTHGKFSVDVSGEYDELLAERIEDETYQGQGD